MPGAEGAGRESEPERGPRVGRLRGPRPGIVTPRNAATGTLAEVHAGSAYGKCELTEPEP